jgi:hypothetical protein
VLFIVDSTPTTATTTTTTSTTTTQPTTLSGAMTTTTTTTLSTMPTTGAMPRVLVTIAPGKRRCAATNAQNDDVDFDEQVRWLGWWRWCGRPSCVNCCTAALSVASYVALHRPPFVAVFLDCLTRVDYSTKGWRIVVCSSRRRQLCRRQHRSIRVEATHYVTFIRRPSVNTDSDDAVAQMRS